MAETEWSNEEAPAPKKKLFPTWLWFCAGGCLLAVIVTIVLAIWGYTKARDAMDSEKQWPKLERLLPFDERPEGMQLLFGMQFGVEQYTLVDATDGIQLQITDYSGSEGEEMRKNIFTEDPPILPETMAPGPLRVLEASDVERGTIDVQGRSLPYVAFTLKAAGLMKRMPEEEQREAFGPAMYLDLGADGLSRGIVIKVQRLGDEELTHDDVREVLAPFHIGPDRER
jgi:hypothetical protein